MNSYKVDMAFWSCLGILINCIGLQANASEPKEKADLIRNAIPQLERLQGYLKNKEIKGTLETEYRTGTTTVNATRNRFRYLSGDDAEIVETQSDDMIGATKVIGANPYYSMILKGGAVAAPYRVEHFSADNKKKVAFEESMDAHLSKYFHSIKGWSRDQTYFGLLNGDKRITIKKVERVKRNSAQLLRIEYDYVPMENEQNLATGGWLELDGERSYAVKESRLYLKGGSMIDCSIEYSDDYGNSVQPRKIVWKTTGSGERIGDVLVETVLVDSWRAVSPESMRLMLVDYLLPLNSIDKRFWLRLPWVIPAFMFSFVAVGGFIIYKRRKRGAFKT